MLMLLMLVVLVVVLMLLGMVGMVGVLVTGKINSNLLNGGNSLRESYVVPVSRIPLGLNVASLH